MQEIQECHLNHCYIFVHQLKNLHFDPSAKYRVLHFLPLKFKLLAEVATQLIKFILVSTNGLHLNINNKMKKEEGEISEICV